MASLLVLLPPLLPSPGRAAQELVVGLDGLELPLDLDELEAWTGAASRGSTPLALWLNLLEPQARVGLVRLLRAPLLRDRSFGVQLLNSWTGEQMLREVGGLLTTPEGDNTAVLLMATLRQLLERQDTITTLDLLQALPPRRLNLRIDGLLDLAGQWRQQLKLQDEAIAQLRRLPLPRRQSRTLVLGRQRVGVPLRVQLAVAHRPSPLPLEIWPARRAKAGPWLLLMPGLGGSTTQLSWLGAALAERGWPVVVIEHPGSDERAVKASLAGEGPPPGAESLPARLADLQAVLAARRDGQLPPLGPEPAGEQGMVLIGHSLGGLAALMAAGMVPERGLSERCDQALSSLPLTNLSRLLQCQLPDVMGDGARATFPVSGSALPDAIPLRGVISFNGFGSLLWPSRGLADLELPVLLVGGSLDLVTPPVTEQLALFVGNRHPRSRLVLVEGGSHFSPVRIDGDGDALFHLGDQLVGVEPQRVQELLLTVTIEFLEGWQHPTLLSPQRRVHNGVTAYVLDRTQAQRWFSTLP
ncbi:MULTISPECIES: alpha/beta hydrolase [Aphanothece]|uniref:alpha/beta hydrolase n=1 Tax=Aphanothece TaxID=1121 RepID=UPI00398478F0